MTGTRVMPGLENLTGRTFGTLQLGEMMERHPQPRYRTTCSQCGAHSTETNSRLVNGTARCRNGGCGKPQRQSGRELLAEQRRQAAEREAQRRAEDLEATEQRMVAEVDDYERPLKYAPTPSQYQPMSERDRIALRERRDVEERERLEADRPRLEAERKAADKVKAAKRREQERTEKQKHFWAEWVQNDRDPKLSISDAMRTASMPQAEADKFNESEVKKFTSTSEYAEYETSENDAKIRGYLSRNGVLIADVETLRGAFVRLRDLDILAKKEPKPVESPRKGNAPTPAPSGPKVYVARDPVTGRDDLQLTERQVADMSADQYRRHFQIAPSLVEWLRAGKNSK